MGNMLVGAGGWAYFQVPGTNSLRAYSSAFNFVEVNSTYYEYPSLRTVSEWREIVPRDFEFSVRCHRDIVQGFSSKSKTGIADVILRMEKTCRILRANALAVLIPESVRLSEAQLVSGLEETLSTFHADGTRIAVEFRGASASGRLLRTMQKNDAVHCVDLSRQQPGYESDVLYTRLFGKGQDNVYEFDDGELRDIATRASAPKFEKSILAFHGVRMYRDAARLKTFLKEGEFPKLTDQAGLDSFIQVLREDTRFPASKAELVERQGWKLFDLNETRRQRAEEYLRKLPEGNYRSLEEVISALGHLFPPVGLSVKTTHAKIRYSS